MLRILTAAAVVSVFATDSSGNERQAFSTGFVADFTPPVAATVNDFENCVPIASDDSIDFQFEWTAAQDAESGIVRVVFVATSLTHDCH